MKTKNPQRRIFLFSQSSLLRVSIFTLLAAAVIIPLFIVSASSRGNGVGATSERTSQKESKLAANPVKGDLAAALKRLPLSSMTLAPQAASPGISTLDSDCTDPQSGFVLGDTVCARAVGGTATSRRVVWIDPSGNARQVTPITTDPQDFTFNIPATQTSVVGDQNVDNRGVWKVNIISTRSSVVATTSFVVKDPDNPSADVSVFKFSESHAVSAGSSGTFFISVYNQGPDTAQTVVLTDPLPNDTTFVGIVQTSGPSFNCTTPLAGASGTISCTIASMAQNTTAQFELAYQVTPGTAAGTDIVNTATVSSPTDSNPDTDNNSSSATVSVSSAGGGGTNTCSVGCPDDITIQAHTTEDPNDPESTPGAIVHYSPPSGNEECGVVTTNHCNDCFFPQGITTVTGTATTGESCSFTVTVTPPGGNAPTISCPPDQSGDANSTCSATFNVGTATATGGENITITASRSDGESMYTCDDFGNCTRNSSDAPFTYGVTTITWIASSHDIPGPYNEQTGDEESHRTGSTTCIQTITVNDVTPPTIAATDGSASADASCLAPVPDYSNTVSDNCSGSVSYTQTPAAGTMVGPGPHTVHIEANDNSSNNNGAGNAVTKDVTFTVNDTTAPAITCPANIETSADPGTCSSTVNPGTATATDNCDSSPTIVGTRSDNQPLNAPYPIGTTTIHWTATDDAGNSSSCDQTVTVNDEEPPTITCPANITVYLPANSTATSTVVTYTAPVGSDNCGGSTTTLTAGIASGGSFPVGTTTVTFRVTDSSGNYTECSFTVTVLYNFTGFFSPVNNPPVFNNVNAGRAIPVKFSLSGYKGMDIFAPGYPVSQQIACDSSAPLADVEGTTTTSGSTLTYSPDQYHYSWKTESSWAGTCRKLIVKLNDGSEHTALFKFK